MYVHMSKDSIAIAITRLNKRRHVFDLPPVDSLVSVEGLDRNGSHYFEHNLDLEDPDLSIWECRVCGCSFSGFHSTAYDEYKLDVEGGRRAFMMPGDPDYRLIIRTRKPIELCPSYLVQSVLSSLRALT